MADREKVIKGLECCSSMNGYACAECPYSSECVGGEAEYQVGTAHLAGDALALLKEQEAKPVKVVKTEYNLELYYCPRCDRPFCDFYYVKPKFCDKCGQELKWSECNGL